MMMPSDTDMVAPFVAPKYGWTTRRPSQGRRRIHLSTGVTDEGQVRIGTCPNLALTKWAGSEDFEDIPADARPCNYCFSRAERESWEQYYLKEKPMPKSAADLADETLKKVDDAEDMSIRYALIEVAKAYVHLHAVDPEWRADDAT